MNSKLSLISFSFLNNQLGMNSFASKGDTQHKLRFAFNIYDIGMSKNNRIQILSIFFVKR